MRLRISGVFLRHGALFFLRFGVVAHMVLCSLGRVMRRMQRVRVGAVRMVGRPLMCARRIMPCGLFVMLRGMFVMLGRLGMMLLRGMFRHAGLPFSNLSQRRSSQGAGRR